MGHEPGGRSSVKLGFFVKMFDTRMDFDPFGCSISLDLDIEEMINQDFNDYTTILPETVSPISGVGLPFRRPATAPGMFRT